MNADGEGNSDTSWEGRPAINEERHGAGNGDTSWEQFPFINKGGKNKFSAPDGSGTVLRES
jgi:hypothetical protein